jgi:hypothetical protein
LAIAPSLALKGKLKTAGSSFVIFIDRLLENRYARLLAFTASMWSFIEIGWRLSGVFRRKSSKMAQLETFNNQKSPPLAGLSATKEGNSPQCGMPG